MFAFLLSFLIIMSDALNCYFVVAGMIVFSPSRSSFLIPKKPSFLLFKRFYPGSPKNLPAVTISPVGNFFDSTPNNDTKQNSIPYMFNLFIFTP